MTTANLPRSVLDPVRRGADWAMRWHSTGSSYVMLLGSSLLLIVVGLIMVLSSSSVSSIADGQSPFTEFYGQGFYALIGGVGMAVASRIPVKGWRALAWPALATAVVLLLMVQFSPLGHEVKGNRNWLKLGGMYAQPSEAAKLALIVWCASVLAMKRHLVRVWSHALIPVVPVAGMVLLLVLIGRDLGTALVMMLLVFGMMFAAGVPLRLFAVIGGLGAVGAVLMVTQSANRMARVNAWLSGTDDPYGSTWQAVHGKFALASGGIWGVGLGGSREKWSYLPEAHNDFIFAIIGEELGLPGSIGVLLLIAVIGVSCARIIAQHDDMFVKVATAGVFSWIVGQSLINIAVVVGLLPVLGIPLPLVSSGGSSLVVTMTTMGMLLAFARSADAKSGEAVAAVDVSRPGPLRKTGTAKSTAKKTAGARKASGAAKRSGAKKTSSTAKKPSTSKNVPGRRQGARKKPAPKATARTAKARGSRGQKARKSAPPSGGRSRSAATQRVSGSTSPTTKKVRT